MRLLILFFSNQIVDFPTCFHSNSDGYASLQDLFLTSCHTLQLCPLSNSDHVVLSVNCVRKVVLNGHSFISFHRCLPRLYSWAYFVSYLHQWTSWSSVPNPVFMLMIQIFTFVLIVQLIGSTKKNYQMNFSQFLSRAKYSL